MEMRNRGCGYKESRPIPYTLFHILGKHNLKILFSFLCYVLLLTGCTGNENVPPQEVVPSNSGTASSDNPDLSCDYIYFSPFPVRVNDTISFEVTIRNSGASYVHKKFCLAEFYIDDQLLFKYDGYILVREHSGIFFRKENSYMATNPGMHHFKLIVDPANEENEINEDNNVFESDFEVYRSFDQFPIPKGIHKDDLRNFQGKVFLFMGHPSKVLTNTFVEYSVTESINYSKTFYGNNPWAELIVGFLSYNDPSCCVIEVPEKKIVITMLNDLNGFSRVDAVLTFWKIRGDSLYFDFYDTNTYVTGIGSSGIDEYAVFPDSSLLIIINSGGGDAGDFWGSYEFVRYEKDQVVEKILEKNFEYSSDDTKPDTTLDYDLIIDNKNHLIVKFIQSYFRPTEGGHRADSTFIGSDTFSINLWELVTKNSAR